MRGHTTPRGRGRRTAAALLGGGALVAALASPAVAGGVTDNKTFWVDIDGTTVGAAPSVFAGDADATISLTIHNTSSAQDIGSADVVVPAPFALVSAAADTVPGGPVVELRNLALAPGGSRTVSLTVDVQSCAAVAGSPFQIQVKQSNDFNGTGNDFFQDPTAASDAVVDTAGTCTLAWVSQPADAERSSAITSVDFDPAGAPIAVEVRDAGSTGRATSSTATVSLAVANPSLASPVFGGVSSVAASSGLATFSPGPTLAVSAFGYTSTASSPGLVSSPASAPFVIVDDQVTCPAGQKCVGSATASKGGQTATATFADNSGSSATNLLVSIDAADAPLFDCSAFGYPKGGLLVGQFVFTGDLGSDRTGTFSMTIPNATKPLNDYEVCWASPVAFVGKSGTAIQGTKPGTSTPLIVGLLPDCAKRGTIVLPCVSGRTYTRATRTVTLTVRASGDDPWRY